MNGPMYPPPPAYPPPTPRRWAVLIEETVGINQSQRPGTKVAGAFATRDEARALAAHLAHTYVPLHPRNPRGRDVFRKNDDHWLVMVPGLIETHTFSVSVVEHIAAYQGR